MRLIAVRLASLLALCSGSVHARPVVVELFTSEGCSSCPPADRYLNELVQRPDLLPLAFHVTYWNSLGWRDPYSFEGATRRQAAYAARLGGGSYTPEMVVDGKHGLVGSERGDVGAAVAAARAQAATSPVARLARTGGSVRIAIAAGQGRGRILLIGYDPRRETLVGRGENSGRTLVESNIVRSLRVVGSYDGAPVDLSAQAGDGAGTAVIVQSADGSIVAAAHL